MADQTSERTPPTDAPAGGGSSGAAPSLRRDRTADASPAAAAAPTRKTTYMVLEVADGGDPAKRGATLEVVGRYEGVDRDQARWAAVDANADLKQRAEAAGAAEGDAAGPRLIAVPERAWAADEHVLEPIRDTRRVTR